MLDITNVVIDVLPFDLVNHPNTHDIFSIKSITNLLSNRLLQFITLIGAI